MSEVKHTSEDSTSNPETPTSSPDPPNPPLETRRHETYEDLRRVTRLCGLSEGRKTKSLT